jgi:hypothetical protein
MKPTATGGASGHRLHTTRGLTALRSSKELVNALRAAPGAWIDTAIVVAFANRFEFIREDHPDPMNQLNSLQEQGGLAIGLAGVTLSEYSTRSFLAKVFPEYENQAWAYRYMDTLRGIVRGRTQPGTAVINVEQ